MRHPPLRSRACSLLVPILALATVSLEADGIADAGPDQTVVTDSDCSARVELDASASKVPARTHTSYTWRGSFLEGKGRVKGKTVTVTLEKGVHEIQLVVESGTEKSTDVVSVTVSDATPPKIRSVTPSQSSLWPPNHRMVPVQLAIKVTDDCDDDPECEVRSIESDEPEDAQEDGHTEPDFTITSALSVLLRAERASSGDGRLYTVRVRCTDVAGNISRSQAQVRVPHDMGREGSAQADHEKRCRLKVRFDDSGKSRIQLRVGVDGSDERIPANETATRKDDLEGYELKVEVGSADFVGVVNRKGIVKADGLRAHWVPKKGLLLLSVNSQRLARALDLDSRVEGKHIEVEAPLEVTVTGPDDGDRPIHLFRGAASCEYRHKVKAKK